MWDLESGTRLNFWLKLPNLHNISFKKHIYVRIVLVLILLYCRIEVNNYIYVMKLNKNIQ